MEVDQVFFCVQMRKFWPTLYFLTVEHAQLMSVIRISQSIEKLAIITTKNTYKINKNKEHTSDGTDMIVKSVFGNCRASRYSFICSYRFCFCFDITLADALIETTFMTLSFVSPCLSRGSFSTANARASERCLGAFWRTQSTARGNNVTNSMVIKYWPSESETSVAMSSAIGQNQSIYDELNHCWLFEVSCWLREAFLCCPEVLVAYVILEHQTTQSIASPPGTLSTTHVNFAASTYANRTPFTLACE